mmetsp:Transcript_18706/g.35098  ORF Transcript_18706/g.35098 Transcript_18706/m.35098 type:complete len:210 (-) Transcript_18706:95-724(-)
MARDWTQFVEELCSTVQCVSSFRLSRQVPLRNGNKTGYVIASNIAQGLHIASRQSRQSAGEPFQFPVAMPGNCWIYRHAVDDVIPIGKTIHLCQPMPSVALFGRGSWLFACRENLPIDVICGRTRGKQLLLCSHRQIARAVIQEPQTSLSTLLLKAVPLVPHQVLRRLVPAVVENVVGIEKMEATTATGSHPACTRRPGSSPCWEDVGH